MVAGYLGSLGILTMWRRTVVTVLSVVPLYCGATDLVRVSYDFNYPAAGISNERASVSVSRDLKGRMGDVAVDRFFDAIDAALVDLGSNSVCEVSAIHAPFVEIDITLNDRKVTFRCAYSDRGVSIPIGATEKQIREAQAFDKIVKLTLDRARVRFFP